MTKRILLLAVLLLAVFASTAYAGDPGRFVIRCAYSHTRQADPIVSPGVYPSAHLHDFYGNTETDENSTPESMRGGPTTCGTPADPSGYWHPTAYLNGEQITPIRAITYWQAPAKQTVETIPYGLEMVAGDSHATGPQSTSMVGWACDNDTAGVIHSPIEDHPYDCSPYNADVGHGNGVTMRAIFPSCWDGTGLRPSDVTYPPCQAPYTHRLIRLTARFHLGIMNPAGLTLSSGPPYTEHFDFLDAFDPARLQQLVDTCLNKHINCKQITS